MAKNKKTVGGLIREVEEQWNRPRKNNYVSFKEISAFSVGGMGVKTLNSMLSYLQLAPTCLLKTSSL